MKTVEQWTLNGESPAAVAAEAESSESTKIILLRVSQITSSVSSNWKSA